MKGATPTRLQLELVCARLLLPGADDSAAGVRARLDRLERRLGLEAAVSGGPPTGEPTPPAEAPRAAAPPRTKRVGGEPGAAPAPAAATDTPASQATDTPASQATDTPASQATGSIAPAAEQVPAAASSGPPGVADVRRLWPEVLVRLREIKRTPWSLISQESAVVEVADGVLTLAFRQPSLRDTFARRDDFQDNLRQAITDVLGVDLRVDAIVDPSADPAGAAPRGRASARPSKPPPEAPPATAAPVEAAPAQAAGATGRSDAPENGSASPPGRSDPDDGVHLDDPDHDDSGLSKRELLERSLGARVIEEIEHS
jgi:DNA polymerase-3 subunit gamma/tau